MKSGAGWITKKKKPPEESPKQSNSTPSSSSVSPKTNLEEYEKIVEREIQLEIARKEREIDLGLDFLNSRKRKENPNHESEDDIIEMDEIPSSTPTTPSKISPYSFPASPATPLSSKTKFLLADSTQENHVKPNLLPRNTKEPRKKSPKQRPSYQLRNFEEENSIESISDDELEHTAMKDEFSYTQPLPQNQNSYTQSPNSNTGTPGFFSQRSTRTTKRFRVISTNAEDIDDTLSDSEDNFPVTPSKSQPKQPQIQPQTPNQYNEQKEKKERWLESVSTHKDTQCFPGISSSSSRSHNHPNNSNANKKGYLVSKLHKTLHQKITAEQQRLVYFQSNYDETSLPSDIMYLCIISGTVSGCIYKTTCSILNAKLQPTGEEVTVLLQLDKKTTLSLDTQSRIYLLSWNEYVVKERRVVLAFSCYRISPSSTDDKSSPIPSVSPQHTSTLPPPVSPSKKALLLQTQNNCS